MTSSLRVLHPPCSENPTNLAVLILSVDTQRYLFNVPEGLTRSLAQKGGALKGLGNVFLPRVGIEECGGLPGLLMTLADAGRSKIAIHGPPLTKHWLATCRFHLYRDNMNVSVRETPSIPQEKKGESHMHFRDDNITIEAYTILPKDYKAATDSPKRHNHIRPSKRQKSSPEPDFSHRTSSPDQFLQLMFPNSGQVDGGAADPPLTDVPAGSDPDALKSYRGANIRDSLEDPSPAPVLIDSDNSLTEQAPVLVHLIRTRVVRGKLNAEKASLLGVPKGKMLGLLTDGQDVEIERPVAWAQWSSEERERWLRKDLNAKKKADKGKPKGQGASADTLLESATENKDPVIAVEKVVVKSAEVMGASRGGAVIGQIYLPSIQYLEPFLASRACSELQSLQNGPHALVHCVHASVLLSPAYQKFLQSLKDTQHIIVSRPFLADRLIFPSSALSSLRMHLLDSTLFPAPQLSLDAELSLAHAKLKGDNIHMLGSDVKIPVFPPGPPEPFDDQALDLEAHAPLSSDKIKKLVSFQDFAGRKTVRPDVKLAKQKGWAKYVEMAKRARADAKLLNGFHHDTHGGTPFKVTPLGTGSAIPMKYRNVSATLLHMPGHADAGFILLDAGESTYGQLRRKFLDKVDEVIGNIRMVFISHSHADHHMGLTRLLKERSKLDIQRPLFVVAPSFIRKYIYDVNKLHSLSLSKDPRSHGVVFVDAEHLDSRSGVSVDLIAHDELRDVNPDDTYWLSLRDKARRRPSHPTAETSTEKDVIDQQYNRLARNRQLTRQTREVMTEILHGTQVYTTEVDHRATNCFGIILRGSDWSVAYSGDTRPCPNLVAAGKGVQLLIHEATIEDSEPEMAHKRGHSTFGQAIDVAKRMGVEHVLLTHFSQRYPKLPKLTNGAAMGALKVAIAFDLLTVQLSDFEKMMRYREALEVLFDVDHEEEGEGVAEGDEETSQQGVENRKETDSTPAAAATHGATGDSAKKITAMDVDKDRIEDPQIEKKGGEEEQLDPQDRRFQRKFVKSYEFQYVSFDLKPMQSKMTMEEAGVPSRLSIARALEEALVDLNGVVNASFNWDLLHIQLLVKKRSIRVVVKVASEHLETLQATISSGLAVHSDRATFLARFDRTLSSLDLIALKLDDSQDWFESMTRGI